MLILQKYHYIPLFFPPLSRFQLFEFDSGLLFLVDLCADLPKWHGFKDRAILANHNDTPLFFPTSQNPRFLNPTQASFFWSTFADFPQWRGFKDRAILANHHDTPLFFQPRLLFFFWLVYGVCLCVNVCPFLRTHKLVQCPSPLELSNGSPKNE